MTDLPNEHDLVLHAEKAREHTALRDAAIRDAVAFGASLRHVADLVGLSHSAVAKIVRR